MEEEGEKRDKWGNKLEFILSCLGYAVGLGNVWRFPYLCGRSGGAAFLIPYIIMMIFAGFPVFYMELALGQYSGISPVLLYQKMCPLFGGIGIAMVFITFLTLCYYNMIIAWALYYFGMTFTGITGNLPWAKCSQDWGTDYCYDFTLADKCNKSGLMYYNRGCINATGNASLAAEINQFWAWADGNETKMSPAAQFLDIHVLHDSGSFSILKSPQWELVICLFVAWVLVFGTLVKGIKSAGKVIYVTATVPYIILIILMGFGLSLEGAYRGVEFYILNPNWTKMTESGTWSDAAQQIFFSLSVGGGGLTTLASYNDFNNNLLRDTMIVVLGNCGTSFFAGFVIFPILGFMSQALSKPVAEIAAQGTTLAFVAYPDAITQIPGAPAWALLFFGMLIMLGLDTQVVLVEVVITAIVDNKPEWRHGKRKAAVVGAVCFVAFLIGIVFTTRGGSELLDLVDTFAGGTPLVIACMLELMMVMWVYGIRRFVGDVALMMGTPPSKFWRLLGYPTNWYWWANWALITPLLLISVMVFQFVGYEDTWDTWWGSVLGWCITGACILPIFLYAAWMLACGRSGLSFKELITPTEGWRPNRPDTPRMAEMELVHPVKEPWEPPPKMGLIVVKEKASRGTQTRRHHLEEKPKHKHQKY